MLFAALFLLGLVGLVRGGVNFEPTFYDRPQKGLSTVNDLQYWFECYNRPLNEEGTVFTNILNVCGGGEMLVGCRGTDDVDTLIVAATILKSDFISGGGFGNTTWYVDPTSPIQTGELGFYDAEETESQPTNCFLATGELSFCEPLQDLSIIPGGYCGTAGYQDSRIFESVYFSNPCMGKNPGDICSSTAGQCAGVSRCDSVGLCVPDNTTLVQCPPPDTDMCEESTFCDPLDANCKAIPVIDGTVCNTTDLCRNYFCEEGDCLYATDVICPPPPECFDNDGCDESIGCLTKPLNNGTSCGANPCSQFATCEWEETSPGVYEFGCKQGPPIECPPQSPCELPGTPTEIDDRCVCVPNYKPLNSECTVFPRDLCVLEARCDADNLCQTIDYRQCSGLGICYEPNAVCVPATGLCSNPPLPVGSPCDTGDPCLTRERCDVNQECRFGQPSIICPVPSNPCKLQGVPFDNNGVCECTEPNAPDGDSCPTTGLDFCYRNATCMNGGCVGDALKDCPEGPCTDGPGVCVLGGVGCSNFVGVGEPCSTNNECVIDEVCLADQTCGGGILDFNNFDCGSASVLPCLFE